MTTREWFRVLRGELWRQDDRLANDVDRVASALVLHQTMVSSVWGAVRLAPGIYRIEDIEGFERRDAVYQAVAEDLRRATLRRCE